MTQASKAPALGNMLIPTDIVNEMCLSRAALQASNSHPAKSQLQDQSLPPSHLGLDSGQT